MELTDSEIKKLLDIDENGFKVRSRNPEKALMDGNLEFNMFSDIKLGKYYETSPLKLSHNILNKVVELKKYNNYVSIYDVYEEVKKYKETHPESFKYTIPVYFGDITKDIFGAINFFYDRLGIGMFPNYLGAIKPFVKNPKTPYKDMIKVKRFSSRFTGFTIIPDITKNNKRLVVIEIEGRDRQLVLEEILKRIQIVSNKDNILIERTAGSIKLYVLMSENYAHNFYYEFPYMYLATVKIQALGQFVRIAPKASVTISTNAYRLGSTQANNNYILTQNGNITNWWDADEQLPEVNLFAVKEWLSQDMRKVVIPTGVTNVCMVSMFVHKRFHKLAMKLKEQSNSMLEIVNKLAVNYMPKHFIIDTAKANGEVTFAQQFESCDTIVPTNVCAGRFVPMFMHEPFSVVSEYRERISFFFDIVSIREVYGDSLTMEEHIASIYKAFELKEEFEQIDEYKDSINSMFYIKYDEKYEFDNYVSEYSDIIMDMYNNPKQKIMVVAPTGAGKTRAFLSTALNNNKKVIYAVPYTSQVEQLSVEYNIPGLYADSDVKIEKLKSTFVTTYDQLEKVYDTLDIGNSNWILVIDEVHNLIQSIDFRPVVKKILTMINLPKVIGITATPETSIDTTMWDYYYKFEQKNSKPLFENIEVTTVRRYLDSAIIDAIEKNGHKEGKIDIVFVKSTKSINKLEQTLTTMGYKVKTIYSYIKNMSTAYSEIINKQIIEDTDFVLTTSVIADGVNILNDNIDTVYIAGIDNGVLIRQFIARFRKGYRTLHYITVISKQQATYYVPRYDVLVSSQLMKKESFVKAYYKSGYDENIISLFGIDENADDLFRDMTIVNDNGKLVVDRSVVMKTVQNMYFKYIFNNPYAIAEFFRTFYMEPKINKIDLKKDDRMVQSLSNIKQKMEMFNIMFKENPQELTKAYIDRVKPSWNINWETIALPDTVSTEVKELMEDFLKYKHVAKTVKHTIELVNEGMQWNAAVELSLVSKYGKRKLLKQVRYLAMLEAIDILEYFELDYVLSSYADRVMVVMKHLAEHAGVLQHQSFEAMLDQARRENKHTDILKMFQVPNTIRAIKDIFRLTYDYKTYRPATRRLVAIETDHRLRVKYKVMYDQKRHFGYKDIKRKTIKSIIESMELSTEDKQDLLKYMNVVKKAFLGSILKNVVTYIYSLKAYNKQKLYNLYYFVVQEFHTQIPEIQIKISEDIKKYADTLNYNSEKAKSNIYGVFWQNIAFWSYSYLQGQLQGYMTDAHKIAQRRWKMAYKYLYEDRTTMRGEIGEWVGTGIEVPAETQPQVNESFDLDSFEKMYQDYISLSASL